METIILVIFGLLLAHGLLIGFVQVILMKTTILVIFGLLFAYGLLIGFVQVTLNWLNNHLENKLDKSDIAFISIFAPLVVPILLGIIVVKVILPGFLKRLRKVYWWICESTKQKFKPIKRGPFRE